MIILLLIIIVILIIGIIGFLIFKTCSRNTGIVYIKDDDTDFDAKRKIFLDSIEKNLNQDIKDKMNKLKNIKSETPKIPKNEESKIDDSKQDSDYSKYKNPKYNTADKKGVIIDDSPKVIKPKVQDIEDVEELKDKNNDNTNEFQEPNE